MCSVYNFLFFVFFLLVGCLFAKQENKGKNLFILAGQSNMEALNPEKSFAPCIIKELGKENIIIVKHAKGGSPIREWYRNWKPFEGDEPKADPFHYEILIKKVKKATVNQKLAAITFIWMQGERDARMSHGKVYKKSLIGLFNQLKEDLDRKDINFVIGRLSDFDLENKKYPHWSMVREIQMNLANENKDISIVNTDDLNNKKKKGKPFNDLHYTKKGYKILGKRFAGEALKFIDQSK